jgi:NhaP-type Na+/H+ and K+/H+ antiporter
MFSDYFLAVLIKSMIVALILGTIARRWKQRSFIGWAAIGGASSMIFPGLSVIALAVLAWLPREKR